LGERGRGSRRTFGCSWVARRWPEVAAPWRAAAGGGPAQDRRRSGVLWAAGSGRVAPVGHEEAFSGLILGGRGPEEGVPREAGERRRKWKAGGASWAIPMREKANGRLGSFNARCRRSWRPQFG